MEARVYTVRDVNTAVPWVETRMWLRGAFESANYFQVHTPEQTILLRVIAYMMLRRELPTPLTSPAAHFISCGTER